MYIILLIYKLVVDELSRDLLFLLFYVFQDGLVMVMDCGVWSIEGGI